MSVWPHRARDVVMTVPIWQLPSLLTFDMKDFNAIAERAFDHSTTFARNVVGIFKL